LIFEAKTGFCKKGSFTCLRLQKTVALFLILGYVWLMKAMDLDKINEDERQDCMCELCHPNHYLGLPEDDLDENEIDKEQTADVGCRDFLFLLRQKTHIGSL
jgi:hypothetical protein